MNRKFNPKYFVICVSLIISSTVFAANKATKNDSECFGGQKINSIKNPHTKLMACVSAFRYFSYDQFERNNNAAMPTTGSSSVFGVEKKIDGTVGMVVFTRTGASFYPYPKQGSLGGRQIIFSALDIPGIKGKRFLSLQPGNKVKRTTTKLHIESDDRTKISLKGQYPNSIFLEAATSDQNDASFRNIVSEMLVDTLKGLRKDNKAIMDSTSCASCLNTCSDLLKEDESNEFSSLKMVMDMGAITVCSKNSKTQFTQNETKRKVIRTITSIKGAMRSY